MRENKNKIQVPKVEEFSWIPLIILLMIPPLWPVTAIVLVKNLHKLWKNGRLKVFRRYALIIGDRPYVRLWELARATGKTKQEVRSDLQEMIDAGYMGPRAYVDQSTDCIVIDPERRSDEAGAAAPEVSAQTAPRQEVRPRVVVEKPVEAARKPVETVQPIERPAVEKKAPAKPQEDEFERILRQIRELNDRIADGPIHYECNIIMSR